MMHECDVWIKAAKSRFLVKVKNSDASEEVALKKAINAALQHNCLYSKSASLNQRNEIRREWKVQLKSIACFYMNDAGRSKECSALSGISAKGDCQAVERYERKIQELKETMNDKFGQFFRTRIHPRFHTDPGFRISHAQKSIAVFLKHLWCMGKIATPPQCPVDRRILKKTACRSSDAGWCYVNSIGEHRRKIQFITDAANGQSLAEWELVNFE